MPSIPPYSRSEKISDYTSACRGVIWQEQRIRASDGTELAVAVASVGGHATDRVGGEGRKRVAICYFQGNGGSLPPRLPALSAVLKSLALDPDVTYTIHALSYRGYWTSRGRPSQPGIELDAAALLDHVSATYTPDVSTVLWGQSLGAGVAVHAAAAAAAVKRGVKHGSTGRRRGVKIEALILETPFVSIKRMLETVYPQRWLPYRYLSPFLWNHWDTASALGRLGHLSHTEAGGQHESPRVLILQAGNDELVPKGHGEELEGACKSFGIRVERVVVGGALHAGCMGRGEGRAAAVRVIRGIGEKEQVKQG